MASPGHIEESRNQEALVASLLRPAVYGGGVELVEKLETHISHLFLAGPYVYKVKKPVDLGFLDFSTLERRHFYCLEELRLNRRLAPTLYLDVVPITGSAEHPLLGGPGTPIEYAVKMRRFAQDDLLDAMLARGRLTSKQIDRLAEKIADFHAAVAVAGAGDTHGSSSAVRAPALENFAQIRQTSTAASGLTDLEALERWTRREGERLDAVFSARQQGGFVRECHGDFHLGNVALVEGDVTVFDCLEFNSNLRWIDVQSEIAFMVMDLQARNRPDLAQRFLNRYLERTGDYAGLVVLRFYLVYRAMVRAKVHALRADQPHMDPQQRAASLAKCRNYLDLSKRLTQPTRPAIVITYGLSGSGKTTHTEKLAEILFAVRIRSDIERKRAKHLPALARTGSTLRQGIYTPETNDLTYARLAELARFIIHSGFVVIVDATFLERARRDTFRKMADSLSVVFLIIEFSAPEAVLRKRVAERQHSGVDASEADTAVLENQLKTVEPLRADEQASAICIDATLAPSDISWEAVRLHLQNAR